MTPRHDLEPTASDWRRWGLDPSWHRRVNVPSGTGTVEWSILDTGPAPRGTIVCVHGNPTWGYLWRDLLRELSDEWRVIAVDQTGMGWSERTTERRLGQRVDELVAFCRSEIDGPIVLVAHDWGGPVAMGAASELDLVAVALANTAVAKPSRVGVPPLIATARSMVDLTCRRTPLFVRGTSWMTDRTHRRALNAPYRDATRRAAVATFVADIPVEPSDPSDPALRRAAANLAALGSRGVPLLLVWGGRDPVFHDRFLADLLERAPHADVQRFPDAAHLVPLDAPMASVLRSWLTSLDAPDATPPDSTETGVNASIRPFEPVTAALVARSHDTSLAYTGPDDRRTWAELSSRAATVASCLVAAGVGPGDRVAFLVPPGATLLDAAYGAWSVGAVPEIADAALGLPALRSALRGATPSFVLGTPRTLLAAAAVRLVPGATRLCMGRFPSATDLTASRTGLPPVLPTLRPDMLAAVVHTSGATGPAKPVRYTHGALAAQRDAIRRAFDVHPERGFLSSFAPFVLLGPALGVPCVLPEGDVTAPGDLDFDRLAEACRRSDLDVAWLSPASARAIVRTAAGRMTPLRLVMLAGAPIEPELALAMGRITGGEVRAPYGMTEAMPLTDGVGATTTTADGTNTGRPLPGAHVVVVPLGDPVGRPCAPGTWGEILVRAPWMRESYDRRWATQHTSDVLRDEHHWHRTGDVGLLTDDGDLVQLGRVQHVITSPDGPLPSVLVERPLQQALRRQLAAIGVGPSGTQALVIVLEADAPLRLAEPGATATVRSQSVHRIAAVLEGSLPLDIRHRSKIRRDELAASVSTFLEGR